MSAEEMPGEMTDGFHLVVEALKLNGVDTIFGVAGIPITDLLRLAQNEGLRYLGFRHEQSAGNAAAIAGYLTQKPGICMTVSAPGFLNGLVALANATTNCFPMIMISGSSDRAIVDLEQGDYEEMDQLAAARPYAKAAYRVNRPQDIGIGVARAIRAAVLGAAGRGLSRSDGRSAGLRSRCRDRAEVADQGRRPGAAAAAVARNRWRAPSNCWRTPSARWRSSARAPPMRGPMRRSARFIEATGIPFLPMSMAKGLLPDDHPQSAAAARSFAIGQADVVMVAGRAPQLAALARPRAVVVRDHQADPDRHPGDRVRQQPGDRRTSRRRHQIGVRRVQRRA